MSWLSQLRSQARFDLLTFRRNPAATFFTVIFPLIFLFLFTGIFGNQDINGVRAANFYVPGILALAIISATMVNIAITTVTRRETGVLKRVRGTPLRPWVFLGSQMLAAVFIALVMTALVVFFGWLVFDVELRAAGVPALAVSLAVASAAFCSLGLAFTTIIPSENAAPAITNAVVLPLYFVSDVFIVGDGTPSFVATIGNLFPVKHLSQALTESFNPFIEGTPMPWGHWAVIAGWGLVGAAVTLRGFRWTPWAS